MTPTGWLVVRDALTIGLRKAEDHVTPHTRPPQDTDADHVLVRTAECVAGNVELELVCEPAPDYGRADAHWTLVDGSRHAACPRRPGGRRDDHPPAHRPRARHRGQPRPRAPHPARGRDRLLRALLVRDHPAPQNAEEAAERIATTAQLWRRWLRTMPIPDHPWRQAICRSALAIKGLTYMPTGSLVAALTTSLPETRGGERNWDYRYTWMRDATFTLRALHELGLDWEAEDFMQFVADLETNEDGSLQIMYGIDGERDLTRAERSTTSPATTARARCGSATARSTSARTTSTAPSSTRSTSTRCTATACPSDCGRSWRARRRAP